MVLVFRRITVAEYRPIQKAPVPKLNQFQKFVSMNNFRTIVLIITVNATELVNQCYYVWPLGSIASLRP